MRRLVVGLSGASGPYLGIRFLEVLSTIPEVEVHLVTSEALEKTLRHETPDWTLEKIRNLAHHWYPPEAIDAPIASGSFLCDAMVVIPCSMRSLAAISMGLGDHLLTRAADVALKERRTLILVPREAPFHLAHLRNMVQVTEMGGIILPPVMAFYHRPENVRQMVDHTVGKILDLLKIPHQLFKRWGRPQ